MFVTKGGKRVDFENKGIRKLSKGSKVVPDRKTPTKRPSQKPIYPSKTTRTPKRAQAAKAKDVKKSKEVAPKEEESVDEQQ